MEPRKKFVFTATLESVPLNFTNAAVFLPHHLILDLPKGRIKVSGLINGLPFSSSIQYRKEMGRFISVSSRLRREANIEAGDVVQVSFKILHVERIEMPESYDTVPEQEDRAKRIWKQPRERKTALLNEFVQVVKQVDSRMRKAIEKIQRAKFGQPSKHQARKRRN